MAQVNDSLSFGSAIYNVLHAGATVDVYYVLALSGATPPYCIYQRQAAMDDYTFGSGHGVEAEYVVKVISNREWPTEALNVYTHIHSLMQDAPLSMTGYTSIRCRRVSTIEYMDNEKFWHVGGRYRVVGWS